MHDRAVPPEVSFVDNVVGDASLEGTGPSLSHLDVDRDRISDHSPPDEVRSLGGRRVVNVTGTAQAGGNVT